jgi:hypothetical protein
VAICLLGVIVSFSIFYVCDENSFIYNDEEQIQDELQEENEQ